MDFPDSPEAIALLLLMLVLRRRASHGARRFDLLDLYAECLEAVNGERPTRPGGKQGPLH